MVEVGCVWGGWCTGSIVGPYGVSLWKYISRGWTFLSCYIVYEIGDGSRVKFWRDRWCGETPLVASYPELFRFCHDKEGSVAEPMKFTNGVLHWDVSFFRAIHNWELEAMLSFMDTIYGTSIKGIEEDKMSRKVDRTKGFMVNAYYFLLVGSNDSSFPWKSIWKLRIPSRVVFFVWIAAWGKCLVIDNLIKRKVWLLDWCYMVQA